jgi:2,4-dienoyl-CoA reductase-like NADH-dependent reductase (Old Yellow Enzyme family)/thioredoxin reductase
MSENTAFSELFKATKIGDMRLKNRMIMPAMSTTLANTQGLVTEAMKSYYEARARGGVSMVIVENTSVDFPQGRHRLLGLSIDGERTLPGLSDLVRLIQKHGARAAIQLHHGGRVTKSQVTGVQPVGPSPVAAPGGEIPRELSREEIKSIVGHFVKAAGLAKRAGFEGIEIHGAHNYLIAQFISSLSNKRHDEYGGSLKNRARLLLEVIEAVRGEVGQQFPVWCRINAIELGAEDGLSLKEALEVARMVDASSADAISISAFGYKEFTSTHVPESLGAFIPFVEAVKKIFRKPVIGVGRITPEIGEEALRGKKLDMIAIGRALIADPDLPNKVASGRLEEIRPCINCYACQDVRYGGGSICCSVNAAAGREVTYALQPVKTPRSIVVIGGGPAGMEAARVAAMRGHRVTLYEKENALGGQLLWASVPPHKEELVKLRDYFVGQLRNLGVQVECGREVTPEFLVNARADALVIATGISATVPAIPGLKDGKVYLAQQILSGEVDIPGSAAIVGGGMVGLETAEFLLERGKKVTIVEMLPELATNMRATPKKKLLDRLSKKSVDIFTDVRCERVTSEGLTIVDRDGKTRTIKADAIVFSTGVVSNNGLWDAMRGQVSDLYAAGDSIEPRGIMEAIDDAMRIATGIS